MCAHEHSTWEMTAMLTVLIKATSQSCSFHSHLASGESTASSIISKASVAYNNKENITSCVHHWPENKVNVKVGSYMALLTKQTTNSELYNLGSSS